MIEHRPFATLGGGDLGWLRAKHHFYVGGRSNPEHRALGDLYVWNDDDIAPGAGFPAHGHVDVEIITYVREGYVAHKDSLGNEGRIEAGDVQVMSAGAGISHDERGSPHERTKIFQIWLQPRARGGEPRWGTKPFPKHDRAGRFVVLASGYEEDAKALSIRSDARVLGATLVTGQSLSYDLSRAQKAYLVSTAGSVKINETVIGPGDGAAIKNEERLQITALDDTELVMVVLSAS